MSRTRTRTLVDAMSVPKKATKHSGPGYDLGQLRPPSSKPFGQPFDPSLYLWYHKTNAAARTPNVIDSLYNTETIIDSDPSKSRTHKPVQHTKTEVSLGYWDRIERSMTKNQYIPWYGSDYGWNIDIYQTFPLPTFSGMSLPATFTETALQQLNSEGWSALYPDFSSGFSAINSIVELKDFRSLFTKICGGAWRAVEMYAKLVRRQKIHRTLGELWLTDNFAIRPLVRDLVEAVNLVKKFDAARKRFNVQGAAGSTHHFTSQVIVSEGTNWSSPFWQSFRTSRTYRHQARVRYSRNMSSAFDAAVRYYGFDMSLEKGWNMIPFSFMLDWFFSIGKSLEAMDIDTEITCDFKDGCSSITREMVVVRHGNFESAIYPNSIVVSFEPTPSKTFGLVLPQGHTAFASSRHSVYVRTPLQLSSAGGQPMPQYTKPAMGIIFPLAALAAARRP